MSTWDPTSKHTTKLIKDQLRAYSSWFFGTEDEPLATRKTHSNIAWSTWRLLAIKAL
jgi:hypothetical protein